MKGKDLQRLGSRNIGFANACRVLGWRLALPVLLLDAAKGFVPLILAQRAGLPLDGMPVLGLAAVFGHIFPLWLRFRGGKGVATGLGVWLAVSPIIALGCAAVYCLLFFLSGKSDIGSLGAMWSGVLIAGVSAHGTWLLLALLFACIGTLTHHRNIRSYLHYAR